MNNASQVKKQLEILFPNWDIRFRRIGGEVMFEFRHKEFDLQKRCYKIKDVNDTGCVEYIKRLVIEDYRTLYPAISM